MGAIIYLICLSGTVAVFLHELERWQQPGIDEFEQMSGPAIRHAYRQFMAQVEGPHDTVWVILPTEDMPRVHVSNGETERFTNRHGELTEAPIEGWVGMVRELHYYLHLPQTFGMIIVGVFGVMLITLVISGVMAHPTIIRDAFKLRVAQSYRLQQTDLHNRLSVWGLPFTLMIALTGAFIGLINILVLVAAPLLFEGDREAVVAAVYGADPVMKTEQHTFDIEKAMVELQRVASEATPIYLAFHQPGSDKQFLEIAATLPGRLVFSEIYRFDSKGNYYNHQGLADGPIGRQVAYSVYRLHFGQFGSFAVKVLYALFGLSLTVASVSGINIWLAKRTFKNWHNDAWAGIVWGAPLALSAAAILGLINPMWATGAFWWVLGVALLVTLCWKNDVISREALRLALALNLIALATSHNLIYVVHWQAMPVMATNLIMVLSGLYLLQSSCRKLGIERESLPERGAVLRRRNT